MRIKKTKIVRKFEMFMQYLYDMGKIENGKLKI